MEAAVGCLHGQGTKFFEVLSKEANLKQEQEEQELERGRGAAAGAGGPEGMRVFTQFESGKVVWNEVAHRMFEASRERVFRSGKHCREHWLNYLDPNK